METFVAQFGLQRQGILAPMQMGYLSSRGSRYLTPARKKRFDPQGFTILS